MVLDDDLFLTKVLQLLLITMMQLPNGFAYGIYLTYAQMFLLTARSYVQFHPLAYLVKLYIEMSMTDLIAKIVRRSLTAGQSGARHTDSGMTPSKNVTVDDSLDSTLRRNQMHSICVGGETRQAQVPVRSSSQARGMEVPNWGITKTMSTEVSEKVAENDDESQNSSSCQV